jgi:hypothetical protein
MNHHSKKEKITSIAIIAIVAALASLGVVVIIIVTIPLQQEAEARGCPLSSPGANASKGRCFHP